MTAKRGRKPLFSEGKIMPQQHAVALFLAQGNSYTSITENMGVSYEAIKQWEEHDIFNELVERYKDEFIDKIKDSGMSNIDFLERTKIESLKKAPDRTTGVRAAEILAKIAGELSPERKEKEVKDGLKKLSNKELAVLEQAKNAANTSASN